MARVCVSCGLTTDTDGKLIVNTGGTTWPYTCDQDQGSPLYCGDDGVLRGDAPHQILKNFTSVTKTPAARASALLQSFGVDDDGQFHDVGTAEVRNFVNPSSCRSMRVTLRGGIQHALVDKRNNGGTRFCIANTISVSGAAAAVPNLFAHQCWAHRDSNAAANFVMVWDTEESFETVVFTVAPGAAFSVTMQMSMAISFYTAPLDTSIQNAAIAFSMEGHTI